MSTNDSNQNGTSQQPTSGKEPAPMLTGIAVGGILGGAFFGAPGAIIGAGLGASIGGFVKKHQLHAAV
jgi:hypothetical protein